MPNFVVSTSLPQFTSEQTASDRYRTSGTEYNMGTQPYRDFYIPGAGYHRSVE
jgi:hypothetical protein